MNPSSIDSNCTVSITTLYRCATGIVATVFDGQEICHGSGVGPVWLFLCSSLHLCWKVSFALCVQQLIKCSLQHSVDIVPVCYQSICYRVLSGCLLVHC